MTIARVIEISASSPKGIEDAVQHGLSRVPKTFGSIEGARTGGIDAESGEDGSHS